VESLCGGVVDGAVRPLGLTIGPGVLGLGQSVLDAVLVADAVEDVRAEDRFHGGATATVFRQLCEIQAVVGELGVDLVGDDLHYIVEEGGAVCLCVGVEEGDLAELGNAVDGKEHEELGRAAEQRLTMRQAKSAQLVAELEAWLCAQLNRLSCGSKLTEVIR